MSRGDRPLLIPPHLRAGWEVWGRRLQKAFDESKVRRHPKGSSKGGQFMAKTEDGENISETEAPLSEPSPEQDADRRAIDRGLAVGKKARAIKDKYGLDAAELITIWHGGPEVWYGSFGPKWKPGEGNLEQTPGTVIHGELNETLGEFGNQPWMHHAWEQAFNAALKGLDRLRYVRGWRYGRIPERDYSHNYRDDMPEAGVSLMEVTDTADDGELPGGPADWVSKMFIESAGKPRVWVEGWLIPQRGSDGEPLVVGAREVEGDS